MEEQLEKTVLDCPLSDLETVKEAEQSGGRESLGRMRRTLLVLPGDTLHLHSPPVWYHQVNRSRAHTQSYSLGSCEDSWATP